MSARHLRRMPLHSGAVSLLSACLQGESDQCGLRPLSFDVSLSEATDAHSLQAIGTVMAVLQGAYTDFLKGVSRPSAQSSSSCVAGACALVDASRAAPGWASESERFRVDDPSRRGSHFF